MTREELVAVRDVIDALLRCPDHVRELLTQWIAPQAIGLPPVARSKRTVPLIFSKPNGLDPYPPSIAPTGKALKNRNLRDLDLPVSAPETDGGSPRRPPTAYAGKARRGRSPLSGKAAERKLLEAMRESPGLSVAALAKAASAGRSTTGGRLRQLAARGVVTKDRAGHWRLVAELVGEAPGPTPAPSN